MEVFFALWVLLVGGWAAWQLLTVAGRQAARGLARLRAMSEERRERPQRERREREAEERRRREDADRRRREDARSACEIFYALHAPEVVERFPRATFDRFVARLLGDDIPPEVVERNAAEVQQLIRRHAEHVSGGEAETVEQVQAWYAAQLRQLEGVSDVRLRQSFEALLLQKYHDRMMRAMGAEV